MTLGYSATAGSRDLRIDLLRGLVMVLLVVVHMEYFSALSMFAWERIGLVSTAEGFVALSGLIIGIVYGLRFDREGFGASSRKLIKRALQLYLVNLFVILSIWLLHLTPGIDAFSVMHWLNPRTGTAYPTYSAEAGDILGMIVEALLLKAGPHQFHVIGL